MGDEVVIPFGTKMLDAAKLRAKEILGLAKEAAKEIKDKLARKNFIADARAQAKQTIEQARSEGRLRGQAFGALRKRAAGLANVPLFPAVGGVLLGSGRPTVGSVYARSMAFAGAISGGRGVNAGFDTLGSVLNVAGMSGNPVAQFVSVVGKQVLAVATARLERELQIQRAALEKRVERMIADADVKSRVERDPTFAREVDAQLRAQHLRSKRQGLGRHPRSSRLAGL